MDLDTEEFPCTQIIQDNNDEENLNESGMEDGDNIQIGELQVIGDSKKGLPGMSFPIYKGENVVGRVMSCNISIPFGGSLSKKHAIIEAENSGCFLFDCGSSNGTKISGVKLRPNIRYALKQNESITFADVKCKFNQIHQTGDDTSLVNAPMNSTAAENSTPINLPTVLAAETPEPKQKPEVQSQNVFSIPESQPTTSQQTLPIFIPETPATNNLNLGQKSSPFKTPTAVPVNNPSGINFLMESDSDTDDETQPVPVSNATKESESGHNSTSASHPSFSTSQQSETDVSFSVSQRLKLPEINHDVASDSEEEESMLHNVLQTEPRLLIPNEYFAMDNQVGNSSKNTSSKQMHDLVTLIDENARKDEDVDASLDEDTSVNDMETQPYQEPELIPVENKKDILMSSASALSEELSVGSDVRNSCIYPIPSEVADNNVHLDNDSVAMLPTQAMLLPNDSIAMMATQAFPGTRSDDSETDDEFNDDNNVDNDDENDSIEMLQTQSQTVDEDSMNLYDKDDSMDMLATQAYCSEPQNYIIGDQKNKPQNEMTGVIQNDSDEKDCVTSIPYDNIQTDVSSTSSNDKANPLELLETHTEVRPIHDMPICTPSNFHATSANVASSTPSSKPPKFIIDSSKDSINSGKSHNEESCTSALNLHLTNDSVEGESFIQNTENNKLKENEIKIESKIMTTEDRNEASNCLTEENNNHEGSSLQFNGNNELTTNEYRHEKIDAVNYKTINAKKDDVNVVPQVDSLGKEKSNLINCQQISKTSEKHKISEVAQETTKQENNIDKGSKSPEVDIDQNECTTNDSEEDNKKVDEIENKEILHSTNVTSKVENDNKNESQKTISIELETNVHNKIEIVNVASELSGIDTSNLIENKNKNDYLDETSDVKSASLKNKDVKSESKMRTEQLFSVTSFYKNSQTTNVPPELSQPDISLKLKLSESEDDGHLSQDEIKDIVDGLLNSTSNRALNHTPSTSRNKRKILDTPKHKTIDDNVIGRSKDLNNFTSLEDVLMDLEPSLSSDDSKCPKEITPKNIDKSKTASPKSKTDSDVKSADENTSLINEDVNLAIENLVDPAVNFRKSEVEIIGKRLRDRNKDVPESSSPKKINKKNEKEVTQVKKSLIKQPKVMLLKLEDDDSDCDLNVSVSSLFESAKKRTSDFVFQTDNKDTQNKEIQNNDDDDFIATQCYTAPACSLNMETQAYTSISVNKNNEHEPLSANMVTNFNDAIETQTFVIKDADTDINKSTSTKSNENNNNPSSSSNVHNKEELPRKRASTRLRQKSKKDADAIVNDSTLNKKEAKVKSTPKKKRRLLDLTESDETKVALSTDEALSQTSTVYEYTEKDQPTKVLKSTARTMRSRTKRGLRSRQNNSVKESPADKKMKTDKNARTSKQDQQTNPKILFTGIINKAAEKAVKKLGGEVVGNVWDATHLVTDKMRRTVKFLCAIARGIEITDIKWILQSEKQNKFLDTNKYPIVDYKSTAKKHSKPGSLFKGFSFHITPSVVPSRGQMTSIIECAGGMVTPRMHGVRSMSDSDDVTRVVVATADDKRRCDTAIKSGIPVVSNEFILTGVMKQEIDFETHKLFTTGKNDDDKEDKVNPLETTVTKTPAKSRQKSAKQKPPVAKPTRASARLKKKPK